MIAASVSMQKVAPKHQTAAASAERGSTFIVPMETYLPAVREGLDSSRRVRQAIPGLARRLLEVPLSDSRHDGTDRTLRVAPSYFGEASDIRVFFVPSDSSPQLSVAPWKSTLERGYTTQFIGLLSCIATAHNSTITIKNNNAGMSDRRAGRWRKRSRSVVSAITLQATPRAAASTTLKP